MRSEYEDALRDFVRYRYGGPASLDGRPPAFDRRSLYADLARLFRRGFPKAPRHEKERKRYEYRRYLARSRLRAWDESHAALLDTFEEEMLALRGESDPAAGEAYEGALAIVEGALEYHATGIDHVRAAVRLDFARFRSAGGAPGGEGLAARSGAAPAERDGISAFLSFLVEDMDAGPALGPRRP